MSFEKISSLQNPRIKNLVRLREANHRRRQQCFLIEGFRMVARAVDTDWPLEAVYCEDSLLLSEEDHTLLDRIAKLEIPVFFLSKDAFKKVAYRENPDGWLAVGRIQERPLESLPLDDPALFLILEKIEKPGNLGAILRTANAAGATGVILSDPSLDLYNPNVIRSSQGAFFDLPIAVSSNLEVQLFLEKHNIPVWVTSPDGAELPWNCPLKASTALVFGAEDAGLSSDWLDGRFPAIALPTHGVTDSLNLSVTVGILAFEVLRQRSSPEI